MNQFYKLSVKDIQNVTDHSVQVFLDIPNELKATFKFKAGQYITFKINLDGNDIRRDYSICSSPVSDTLSVAIKVVDGGVFSTYANKELKKNDVLEVSPPKGRFTFEPDQAFSRRLIAYAAGSGITPILGIMKTLLTEEPKSNFLLVYGNKTPESTMFLNDISVLKQNYPRTFQTQLLYSQANEENAVFGRIDKSTVNLTLNKYPNLNSSDTFYLCGPQQMIQEVKSTLLERGVSEAKILFELFTAPSEESTVNPAIIDGQSEVIVMVDDEETKNILDMALSHNIDAPYSCQGGICSSCLARLKKGKAVMTQNNVLTDSEVAEGLILTCQAHPTTSSIYVDYDDV
jgi:ring-1,2-phenylacetyl-CoA epoxidase subunit PaaE